jgi:hypothetical protein
MTAPPAARIASRLKKSWLRRWVRRLGLLVLILVLLVLGVAVYHRTIGGRRLAAAVAAADQLDPDWHWEDLSARRAAVADDQNAAPVVVEAAKLLPETWPPKPAAEFPLAEEKSIVDRIRTLEASEQLDAELIEAAREELRKVEPALRVAHRLAEFRTGRYPDLSSNDYHLSGTLRHLQQCRQVGNLLWADAALRAQEGKTQAALESSRCLMITGRSIGDEPGMIAHLVRNACGHLTVLSIERTLAQGQPAENDLNVTQQLLQDEQAQNTLIMALRGERAFEDQVMNWIDADDREHLAAFKGNELVETLRERPWLTAFCHWFMVGWLKENHAVMLELSSEAVEIAKLPVEEQVERYEQLLKKSRAIHFDEGWPPNRYAFGTFTTPAMVKVAQSFARTTAELRCAAAALAAERFRLAHDRWPNTLDELAPQYLTATTVDPFDGKPLKLRRFDDGILIYSVGVDRVDDGGKVDRQSSGGKGEDVGCRLWDVQSRRQPPRPRPPENGEEKGLGRGNAGIPGRTALWRGKDHGLRVIFPVRRREYA